MATLKRQRADGTWEHIQTIGGNEINSLQISKADKTYVDSKVKKNVPAEAKFTDTVYTAGDNISISGTVISAKDFLKDTGGTMTGDFILGEGAQIKKIVGAEIQVVVDEEGKVWKAVYNDLAELMLRDNFKEPLKPGDVLVMGNKGLTRSIKEEDNLVIGVYSDTYGMYLGGEENLSKRENLEKYVPVGISGRVLVNVEGSVKKGDLLVSSNKIGYAKVMEDFVPGTVFGKAMEDKESTNTKRIWALIMNC